MHKADLPKHSGGIIALRAFAVIIGQVPMCRSLPMRGGNVVEDPASVSFEQALRSIEERQRFHCSTLWTHISA